MTRSERGEDRRRMERVFTAGADGRPALHSPRALLDAARAATGADEHDGPVDAEALEVLCAAFRDDPLELTFLGRKRAEAAVVNAIGKRWRLARHLARHPEIAEAELPPAIVVAAPPRTGTTFVQRLLANDPHSRWPRSWEVFYPPPREPDLRGDPRYFTEDERIGPMERSLRILHRQHPELARHHPVDADSAEECFGLLETSLTCRSFLFQGAVARYLRWVDERPAASWRAVYRLYADQLRLLQWWAPGRHWVLKSPLHLWSLGPLLEHLPRVVVVLLHRSPVDAMTSYCNLMAATLGAVAGRLDDELAGALAREFTRDGVAACVSARRSLPADRFVDLAYDDVVARPLEAVRTIYDAAGLVLDDDAEERMVAWLAEKSAPPARPRHRPLAAFGLSADEVREDCAEYDALLG